MPACVFCSIAQGDARAAVVYEDDSFVAFLDHRPVFHGHTLVVPRAHADTLLDCPPELLAPLFELVRRVAGAVETGLGAGGSFVAINNRISQSVPHLHVHVVPRTKGDGLRGFFWPRTKYEDAGAMEAARAAIAGALA
ncbi:MAG TPA: HIT family protein [Actinomycetota bacterium]|nr:HIT family protein [Actinomycetota bacterium]